MTAKNKEEFAPLKAWVSSWLSTNSPESVATHSLKLLKGDGSQRKFFRLVTSAFSRVVLFDPGWLFTKDYAAHQKFLREKSLPVPEFFAEDPKIGILLMEDLGDVFLQNLIDQNPANKMPWLERAVDLVASLHGQTFPPRTDLPVSTRSFDQQKLGEELRFMWTHLVEGLLGRPKLSKKEENGLDNFCLSLAKYKPQVFCHRDFHSRNLMVKNGALYMIDFQDARMGPPSYDLASLVFDPYIQVTEEERSRLISRYKNSLGQWSLGEKLSPQFDEEVKLIAIQRLLKAAGSFASFFTRFEKTTHLEYLEPALETSQQLLKSAPELDSLFPVSEWLQSVRKLRDNNWQK